MAFVPEAKDGFQKHSFTNLRKTFPNLVVHKILNEAVFPLRVELMRRTEGGGETIVIDSLRVLMLDSLQYLVDQIRDYANTVVFEPDVKLADMKKRRDAFTNRMLKKGIPVEDEVRSDSFTHADELLLAADPSVYSITINFEGDKDLDWRQPTRERIQNPLLREVIIALDKLTVIMSVSHSADNQRTIIADEASRWILEIMNIYHVVDNYDPGHAVFMPTALSLNERENGFNADGTWDIPVIQGTATGEVLNTPRTNFDTTVQNDDPMTSKVIGTGEKVQSN